MIRLYIRIPEEFVRVILQDRCWVVHIPLVCVIKFRFFAQSLVDHFTHYYSNLIFKKTSWNLRKQNRNQLLSFRFHCKFNRQQKTVNFFFLFLQIVCFVCGFSFVFFGGGVFSFFLFFVFVFFIQANYENKNKTRNHWLCMIDHI